MSFWTSIILTIIAILIIAISLWKMSRHPSIT